MQVTIKQCIIKLFSHGELIREYPMTDNVKASNLLADFRNAISLAKQIADPTFTTIDNPDYDETTNPGVPKKLTFMNPPMSKLEELTGNPVWGVDIVDGADITVLPYVAPIFGDPKNWDVSMELVLSEV